MYDDLKITPEISHNVLFTQSYIFIAVREKESSEGKTCHYSALFHSKTYKFLNCASKNKNCEHNTNDYYIFN